MRLLICAGGTGGGVYPALSVLQALSAGGKAEVRAAEVDSHLDAQPAPDTVLWIGGERGMEADLVRREGISFETIPAAGVHGVGMRALPGNLRKLAMGFRAARQIVGQFRPEVVFFTGGYVAVPMALAASLPMRGLRRPGRLVYVPDIEPGLALKLLVRLADCVAVSVEETKVFLPRKTKMVVSGYPVRAGLRQINRSEACRALGLNPELPVFLILGGSKGARSINRALGEALPQLLEAMQVVHLSGQLDWQEVEQKSQQLTPEQQRRYRAFAYLHDEMSQALSAADLVLARAGASSLGELPMFGLPAILVPYPYAWRYQRVNAEYLVSRGAAQMIRDADLGTSLLPLVKSLMADAPRRQQMAAAMRALARPEAARTIAGLLTELEAEARLRT